MEQYFLKMELRKIMAVNKELKYHILQEIGEILVESGTDTKKLVSLRKKYQEVPKNTFYRWVKKLEKDPSYIQVKKAKEEISKKSRREAAKDNLPFIPSAKTVASVGIETFDFMLEMKGMYDDAKLIRKKAVKVDENGNEEAKNPRLLAESIKLRKGLVDTRISAQHLLMDMNRLARSHNMILDTVARLAPDVFEIILKNLEEMDAELGSII